MSLNLSNPELPSGDDIDGICVGFCICEVNCSWAHRYRSANACLAAEDPVRAAGLRIQRVNGASLAGNINSASDDSGLNTKLNDAIHTKCPFEFQIRNLCSGQSALFGGL